MIPVLDPFEELDFPQPDTAVKIIDDVVKHTTNCVLELIGEHTPLRYGIFQDPEVHKHSAEDLDLTARYRFYTDKFV